MAESVEHIRCKAHIAEVLSGLLECRLDPSYRSDFCGVVKDRAVYGEVDCRRIQGFMCCWISVYDMHSHRLLHSWPCPLTPMAIQGNRDMIIGNRECLSCDGVPVRNRAVVRMRTTERQ